MREEASDGGFVKGIPMIYEGSQVPLSLLKEEPVQFSALCTREVSNLRGTGTGIDGDGGCETARDQTSEAEASTAC